MDYWRVNATAKGALWHDEGYRFQDAAARSFPRTRID